MQQIKQNAKKKMGGRATVLLTLLALLAVSSYANYRIGQNAAVPTALPVSRVQGAQPTTQPVRQTEAKLGGNTFADYREQRGAARAQEIQMLDEMIADTAAGEEPSDQARTQKLAIVRSMEQETVLEGLLKAKGFEDVLVSARSGAVTVVVKRESITSSEATQILEMAVRETGEEARNVKIIPTK